MKFSTIKQLLVSYAFGMLMMLCIYLFIFYKQCDHPEVLPSISDMVIGLFFFGAVFGSFIYYILLAVFEYHPKIEFPAPDNGKTMLENVEHHLLSYGEIDTWTAFTVYRITRLSAIIYKLRHKRGMKIETVESDLPSKINDDTKLYRLINPEKTTL